MIKFTAISIIHAISPVINVTERFQKRELVLDESWTRDGEKHTNYVQIEFSGDKMAELDGLMPGQRVTVEAIIAGREYNGKIFNSLRGQSCKIYAPPQQPTATPTPTTAPMYTPPPVDTASNTLPLEADDLPF